MNKNEELFTIHIQIAGFNMPLKIKRKDEEIYRNAEKLVVRFLEQYQKIYNQQAAQNIYIMVAFKLATVLSQQEMDQDLSPVVEKIKVLDQELEQLLANK